MSKKRGARRRNVERKEPVKQGLKGFPEVAYIFCRRDEIARFCKKDY
jgi:hypothetical protein